MFDFCVIKVQRLLLSIRIVRPVGQIYEKLPVAEMASVRLSLLLRFSNVYGINESNSDGKTSYFKALVTLQNNLSTVLKPLLSFFIM